MAKTVFKTKEKKLDAAILIVDKVGIIGNALAEEFSKDFYVTLVSGRVNKKFNSRVQRIVFKGKLPKIPKNRYLKMFLIDDGTFVTKDSSSSFIEEARKINADFYFLGSIRNLDVKHSDQIIKIYNKAKVLIFGDLFDDEYLFDPNSSITKFIISASGDGLIKVPGDGLSFSFPMSFKDTIKLIIKASYLNINENIILLFYKFAITDISLAHIFQKIDPDVRVDFIREGKRRKIFIPDGAEYAISKYDLKKKIEELNLEKVKFIPKTEKTKKQKNLKPLKLIGFISLMFLFIFSLPFLTSTTYYFLGKSQLQRSFDYAKSNNFEKAIITASSAGSFFQISKNANEILMKQLNVIGQGFDFSNQSNKYELQSEITNSAVNLFTGLNYLKKEFYGKGEGSKEELNSGLESLKKSYTGLFGDNFSTEETDSFIAKVKELGFMINFFGATSDVLPNLLGYNGMKNYLILFQNSSKLTPSGGQIDVIGKISLFNGKIVNFDLLNADSLDENLRAKNDSPYFIKRYLNKDVSGFKEINYDPDFIKSAMLVESLYSSENKDQIDGVVGADSYFIKNLLESTGPIYVKSLDKDLGSENVIQALFVNNSDDVIFEIMNTIKTNKSLKNKLNIVEVLSLLGSSIEEKHLLFSFKNQEAQSLFIKNNFSGSLLENRVNDVEKINDYLGVSEYDIFSAGISGNVLRSIKKENSIKENGDIESSVSISFNNRDENDRSNEITYKSYIQLILPQGSNLDSVSVGGREQKILKPTGNNSLIENLNGIEVDEKTYSDKSVFGFFISVAPNSLETVRVKCILPFSFPNQSKSLDYSLVVYKQPGIDYIPFTISFNKNTNYVIIPDFPVSKNIKKDEEFTFEVIKK